MPHIPGRRVLAACGSLALVLGTTPVTAAARSPSPFAAQATACAPPPAADGRHGLSEVIPTGDGYAPATGTVSALTLFIDFPGSEARISTRQRLAEFFPATADYFAASSGGSLRYRVVPVHRWLRMSQPFEAYGIERGTGWHPDDPQGYNRLMREIAAAAGDDADLAAHDLVNVLAAPGAGPPATEQVLSVSFPGRPLVRLPGGGALRNVSFIWSRQPGESPHRVLVHENGHSFGLPDLYWTGRDDPPLLTGHWDVMEQAWGPSNDFLAWHKWKLGWFGPGQVACVARRPGAGELVLSPSGQPGGDTTLLVVRTGRHAALTVEVRVPGRLDDALCRPGVLISRVDTRVATGRGPVRVVDATPGSDGCRRVPHAQVTSGLTDAPFRPGQVFHDERTGVRVAVLEADRDGRHRIRVTRP